MYLLDYQDTAEFRLRYNESERQLAASLSKYWSSHIRITFPGSFIFDPTGLSKSIPAVHDRNISQAIAASCYETCNQDIWKGQNVRTYEFRAPFKLTNRMIWAAWRDRCKGEGVEGCNSRPVRNFSDSRCHCLSIPSLFHHENFLLVIAIFLTI